MKTSKLLLLSFLLCSNSQVFLEASLPKFSSFSNLYCSDKLTENVAL